MKQILRKAIWPVFLIALAIGSQPSIAAFWQWSKTASNDANADPTINWAEGMSPSSVNDSARAMMARAAEYRDDIAGALVTSGSSTAYTATTNQGFNATPPDGTMIAITPNVTSGVNPTITFDGGTAYRIWVAPSTSPPAGTLVAGTPYSMTFSVANNGWILRNFYGNPYSVPIGAMLPFTGTVTPNSSFIFPIGTCISRTTYATYFAMVGTTFGTCDGVTTFGTPDMRGLTISGTDAMGGSGPRGKLSSTYFGADPTVLGNIGGNQSHTLTITEMPSHNHANTLSDPGHRHTISGATNVTSADGTGTTRAFAQSIQSELATTGITITNAFTGGGAAHSIVQPTMVMSMILRVM